MERLTKIVDRSIVFPSELAGVSLAPDNEIMHALLTRLATYEDAMSPERAQELAKAEKDGRLVVLQEGEDSAALAATIDGDDRLCVWCEGDSDLLIAMLSVLAGEVADELGTRYSTLLISIAMNPPVNDLFDGKGGRTWLST